MEEKPRPIPYPVRMPEDLREKLETAAKNGARSLHAEVIARLEASFTTANVDRDLALAQGAAGAVLKGLERVNENVALFAKRMDRIEAKLVAGGASPLEMGDIAVVLGPAPEETQHKAKVEKAASLSSSKLKIPAGRDTQGVELKPPPQPVEGGETVKVEVSTGRPPRIVNRRK